VLGDYVSRDKMLAVRDGCAKVLGASSLTSSASSPSVAAAGVNPGVALTLVSPAAELKMRADNLQATLDEVVGATQAVQADLEATR